MAAKSAPPIPPNTRLARRPSTQAWTEPVGAAVKRLSHAWEKRGPGNANSATAHRTKSTIRVPASAIADAPGWSRNERVLSLVMAIHIIERLILSDYLHLRWLAH